MRNDDVKIFERYMRGIGLVTEAGDALADKEVLAKKYDPKAQYTEEEKSILTGRIPEDVAASKLTTPPVMVEKTRLFQIIPVVDTINKIIPSNEEDVVDESDRGFKIEWADKLPVYIEKIITETERIRRVSKGQGSNQDIKKQTKEGFKGTLYFTEIEVPQGAKK